MSEPRLPGDLPPDVSPEYAEAYRRAYLRALGQAGPTDPADAEETQRIEQGLDALLAAPPPEEYQDYGQYDAPTHRDGDFDAAPEPPQRPTWLVPALLAGMVVLLIAAAYGAGALFSSSVDDTSAADDQPTGVVMDEDGSTSSDPSDEGTPDQTKSPEGKVYDGRTDAAAIGSADASCQAPSSVDAAGNPVRYPASNVYDGDLTTAWRCTGDGVGQRLQLNLSDTVRIGELGIVPGYAKTDPRSGADRYAQNNRLTKVRWSFPDGTSVVQKLDGSKNNRDLQTMAIPLVEANTVTLEVLASAGGKRNTIAVSEVRVGAAAD